MTLSISMIVKNEERYIYDCLQSVRDVADEIIIVDTGSTDLTVSKILKSPLNIKLYQANWDNDFSEARNYSLSKCTGDWILFLDADERLDPRFVQYINSVKKMNENFAYYVLVRSSGNTQVVARNARLFRNNANIKFTGKIHEQIAPSLAEQDYKFFLSPITIHHIGYDVSDEDLKTKAARNLQLLNAEDHRDIGYDYYLAEAYFALGNSPKAQYHCAKVLESEDLPQEIKAHACCMMAQLNKDNEQLFHSWLQSAEELAPHSPEPAFLFAEYYNDKKSYERALQLSKIKHEPFFQIIYDHQFLRDKIKNCEGEK